MKNSTKALINHTIDNSIKKIQRSTAPEMPEVTATALSDRADTDAWDIVIKPKKAIFDLQLKELWRYRDLLGLWVRREFVGAYKQTLLGPLWHFISPLFSTLTFMLIFGKIAQLPTDGVPMFLFYNAGITLWNFFNGSFGSSSGAFLSHSAIFGKVYFPRLIMPIASVVSTLIKFGIQFAFFIVAFILIVYTQDYNPVLGWKLLYLPISLLLMAGIGFGFGIIVSSLTTKYRDLNMLTGFGMQLLMYATPVIYSYTSVAPEIKRFLVVNPLVFPMESFKYALFGVGEVTLSGFIYSFVCMIVVLVFGITLFNKAERNFMDIV